MSRNIRTLGERIRELREQCDFSLREFAKLLGGLSPAFLSDIELGRRHPSDKVLADMARVLKTTVEDLKSYDTRPPVEEMKRLATSNPLYGRAFRRIVEDRIAPEDILKLSPRSTDKEKKKK